MTLQNVGYYVDLFDTALYAIPEGMTIDDRQAIITALKSLPQLLQKKLPFQGDPRLKAYVTEVMDLYHNEYWFVTDSSQLPEYQALLLERISRASNHFFLACTDEELQQFLNDKAGYRQQAANYQAHRKENKTPQMLIKEALAACRATLSSVHCDADLRTIADSILNSISHDIQRPDKRTADLKNLAALIQMMQQGIDYYSTPEANAELKRSYAIILIWISYLIRDLPGLLDIRQLTTLLNAIQQTGQANLTINQESIHTIAACIFLYLQFLARNSLTANELNICKYLQILLLSSIQYQNRHELDLSAFQAMHAQWQKTLKILKRPPLDSLYRLLLALLEPHVKIYQDRNYDICIQLLQSTTHFIHLLEELAGNNEDRVATISLFVAILSDARLSTDSIRLFKLLEASTAVLQNSDHPHAPAIRRIGQIMAKIERVSEHLSGYGRGALRLLRMSLLDSIAYDEKQQINLERFQAEEKELEAILNLFDHHPTDQALRPFAKKMLHLAYANIGSLSEIYQLTRICRQAIYRCTQQTTHPQLKQIAQPLLIYTMQALKKTSKRDERKQLVQFMASVNQALAEPNIDHAQRCLQHMQHLMRHARRAIWESYAYFFIGALVLVACATTLSICWGALASFGLPAVIVGHAMTGGLIGSLFGSAIAIGLANQSFQRGKRGVEEKQIIHDSKQLFFKLANPEVKAVAAAKAPPQSRRG